MSSSKTEIVERPSLPDASIQPMLLIFGLVGGVVVGISAAIGGGGWALAALVSALACFGGAIAGHFLSIYPRGEAYLLARLYASMAARAGLPLLAVLVCNVRFESLFSKGMVYFVILFYLVGLLTDLTIRMKALRAGVAGNGQNSQYNKSNVSI